MDYLLAFSNFLALSAIPIVIYLVLFKEQKNNDGYSDPEWYYLLKFIVAKRAVKKYQEECRKALAEVPEDEQPKKLTSAKHTDNFIIHGLDQKGNSLSTKIIVRQNRVAELSIILQCNGKVYILPNEPKVLVCSTAGRQWKVAGFELTILEPFKRLRITYNGFLRDITRENTGCGNVDHVQFHFIWNCAEEPLHYPQDLSADLLADGIAREPWRDGDWLRLIEEEQGYEQFGAMQGFVKGSSFTKEQTFNFPSYRKRFWSTTNDLFRDFSLFVVAHDGTLINMGAKSYKGGCTQLKYGSVLFSNGECYKVDRNDLRLRYTGRSKSVPDCITMHVKANGKTIKCVTHLNTRRSILTHNRDRKGWQTDIVKGESGVNAQQATALATFWWRILGKRLNVPAPLLVGRKKGSLETKQKFVAQFSDEDCKVLQFGGGKGSSLALLSTIRTKQFIVPQGFVVLASALKKQMQQNPKLAEMVLQVENVAHGKIKGKLADICKQTVALFVSEPIDEAITKEILKQLSEVQEKLNASDTDLVSSRWAVRSSGLFEDTAELSAAGQNATILGCSTDEGILQAVANCWGSLYTFHSVQYRRQHGLPVRCEMAVVIQKMVPSDSAGVLFTCHPSTGDPSQMVVTSNYGLGESVVSGQADPDTIILSRTWNGNVKIFSQTIGDKQEYLKLNDNENGTELIVTNKKMVGSLSLDGEQAFLLGKVGVLLEKELGSPQDIEWAFYKDKLYLLQSRPITTLSNWTDFELSHEFDTPVVSENTLSTKANTAEVLPGAMTILTQGVVCWAIENAMTKHILGCLKDPYVYKLMSTSQHHIFLNVLNGFLRNVGQKIDLNIRAVDLSIFGRPVIDEKIHAAAVACHGYMTTSKKIYTTLDMLKSAWHNNKIVKKASKLAAKFEIPILEEDVATVAYDKIFQSLKYLNQMTYAHCNTSRVSVFYQMVATNILVEGKEDLTKEHFHDIGLILSSCSNMVSAEIPAALEKISNVLRNEGLAEEFVKVQPEEGAKWLKLRCPKASQEIIFFLEKHGHRVVKEFELKEDPWSIKPIAVINMIQANCKGDKVHKKADTVTAGQIVSKLITPQRNSTRTILRFVINKCRTSVVAREQTKSELVRVVHTFRLAFRELARRMVQEGFIPDEELIYHFSLYEIGQILSNRDPILISKGLRRHRLYNNWNKLIFPEILYGVPKAEDDNNLIQKLSTSIGRKLTGTSVYPGDVVARACVITTLEDIGQLRAGDILVTCTTDIGWSPYFPILSGIATELGGLISHGAVVAREYGLPCVVGVQGATKMFKTGDNLLLSGNEGTLTLVNFGDNHD